MTLALRFAGEQKAEVKVGDEALGAAKQISG
jgi:hypothetical protein